MKKKPADLKVVFLAANSSYSHTSLAAMYLRAFTADMGIDWTTVELVATEDFHPALRRIAQLKPDVLAATFYLFNRNAVLSVLRRYRLLDPECRIVAGGPEFLGDNRDFLTREHCIDAAVRGEGERAFRQLLGCIAAAKPWHGIQGFCGMVNGKYVDNGLAEQPLDLDDIPSPYGVPTRKPFLQLETSRGCGNRCAFCTSGTSGGTRYFSISRVQSDLKKIRKAGVRSVRIVDRTFNGNRRRCIELLRMFRQEFGDLAFHLEIDPALAGPEVLGEMAGEVGREVAHAGHGSDSSSPDLHLDVGMQSFNPAVLEASGRRGGARAAIKGLEALCGLRGVAVHADLIAGLPGATLRDTLNDLRRLVALRPAEIQLELLKVLPGTRLQSQGARTGIVASPEPPYEVLRTGTMSDSEIYTSRMLCRLVDWFYEPKALREAICRSSDSIPSFWRKLVTFCSPRFAAGAAPSLANRFRLLDEFLAAHPARDGERHTTPDPRHLLRYAWMKHGLGSADNFCGARPWKEPVPADAVLVEGDATAEVCRMFIADIGRTYIFAYGRTDVERHAVAVWKMESTRKPGRPIHS
ncbi:MAG: radical SAM protein [bacterium]